MTRNTVGGRAAILVAAMAALGAAVVPVRATVAAGADAGATVSVSGQASLTAMPELVRVRATLTADGKDAKEAVANLAARRAEMKKKLLAAGATEASVAFGATTSGTDNLTAQQRQMQQLMAMQRNRRAATTGPAVVTVSCTATADWPLVADSGDAAVVAAADVVAKAKAAMSKPAAAGAASKPTSPEDQEMAEEAAAAMQQQMAGAATAVEPVVVYVHKVTDGDRAKLMADAVAKATADAKRLAAAAGRPLGEVRAIEAKPTGDAADDQNPMMAYIRAMADAQAPTPAGPPAGEDEAVGNQPTGVTFTVGVKLTFGLGN